MMLPDDPTPPLDPIPATPEPQHDSSRAVWGVVLFFAVCAGMLLAGWLSR